MAYPSEGSWTSWERHPHLQRRWPASWMWADSATWVRTAGANEVAGTKRAWWFENSSTKASIFRIARCLAASKPSTPSPGLSLNTGPDATSSVLLESPQNQINAIFNQKHSFEQKQAKLSFAMIEEKNNKTVTQKVELWKLIDNHRWPFHMQSTARVQTCSCWNEVSLLTGSQIANTNCNFLRQDIVITDPSSWTHKSHKRKGSRGVTEQQFWIFKTSEFLGTEGTVHLYLLSNM